MKTKASNIFEKIMILLTAIIIILMLIQHISTGENNLPDHVTELSDGWYYMKDGKKIDVTLPTSVSWNSDENLVLYNDTLSPNYANQMLTTHGAIYHLAIAVGGKVLYQYEDAAFPRNAQMASKVNCAALLPGSYDGRTVTLTYTPDSKGIIKLDTVHIGSQLDIFFYYCSRSLITLFVIFVMIILAITTVSTALYLFHLKVKEKRFIDISYFLLFCGCWFLTDSSLAQIFGGSSPFIRYLSFYAFMLMSVPILYFIRHTECMKKYKIIDVIIWLFYGNVLLQSLLNYLGIFDFIDMLPVTHGLLSFGIAVLLPLLIKTYRQNHDSELYGILNAFAVLAAGGVVSIILYWTLKISYYEVFYEFGIVIFIIMLFRLLIIAIVDNLNFRAEILVYQRLSQEDSLTGLKNRRAFDELLTQLEYTCNSYDNLMLIFMDLNYLKKINDTLGHKAGDELIMAAAQCITNAYGAIGSCFRIGGDEFCVVVPNTSLTKKELFARLDEELEQYNKLHTKYTLSMARGLSNIRDEHGNLKTISDWKTEADTKMYENKGWIRRQV